MGTPAANSHDVVFAYGTALQAARDLNALAIEIHEKQTAWAGEAAKAVIGWEGGHRDFFNSNLITLGTDAAFIIGGLTLLADLFAAAWATARGEQDRINWARWVQAQKDDDWWGEDVVDFFYEEDMGEPPADPPRPTAEDGYQPTRQPIHPEYQHTPVYA
jgi:hypothetical protein